MRDDVSLMVHHEDAAPAHAGILQPVQNRIQRNHRRDHSGELLVHIQRNCDDKRRLIIGFERQRIAAKFHRAQLRRLHAGHKCALQCFADEGILLRAKISLRSAGALAGLSHRRQIKKCRGIAFDRSFEQPRDPGFRRGIFNVLNQAAEHQDLAFAHQLLRDVGFVLLEFLRQ